jgi:plasmid segregation protein ParM
MKEQVIRIIDPGYWTLDWLLTDAVTPIDARSGAVNNRGMAEIVREVIEHVAKDFSTSRSNVGSSERIDKALRSACLEKNRPDPLKSTLKSGKNAPSIR